jgi:ElaB/YqjD/DUF883 family membrane-anchored ribosome-binding protein
MNSTTETSRTPDTLVADIAKLMDEVEQMLADSTSHHAEEKIELLRSRFHNAQDRLGSLYSNARTKFVNGAKQTDETIRAHPYESIGIALGLGVLLGAVLGRRIK